MHAEQAQHAALPAPWIYWITKTPLPTRRGVRPFPHPDVMLAYGSKDSLVKVASTAAGLEDTQAYLTVEEFREKVTSCRRPITAVMPKSR